MLKRTLLILLGLISSIFCFAQNHIPYYKLTQKAESAILENNHKKAIKLYKKAYTQYLKTFKQDDINALHCALLVKDYESAVFFHRRLLEKNWDTTKLFKQELENYTNSEPYKQNAPTLVNLRAMYLKKEVSPAIYLLNNMVVRDQQVRHNIQYDASGKDTTVLQMDSLLCVEMIDLFNKYGFPNESEHKEKYISAEVIFTHDAHWRGVLIPHLKRQGLRGNFHLSKYMYYSDEHIIWSRQDSTIGFRNMFDIADYSAVGNLITYNGKLWQRKLTKIEAKEVNNKRKILGFGSIQEQQKKLLFQYSQENFTFWGVHIDNLGRNLPPKPAKKLEEFLKNYYEQVPANQLNKKFKQTLNLDDTN